MQPGEADTPTTTRTGDGRDLRGGDTRERNSGTELRALRLCAVVLAFALLLLALHICSRRDYAPPSQRKPLLAGALSSMEKGDYFGAVQYYSAALDDARKRQDRTARATSLCGLAFAYHVLAQDAKAEVCGREAVAVLERSPVQMRTLLCSALVTLSDVYAQMGNYDEAEEVANRAVAESAAALGKEAPETLRSIDALANVYRLQRRYREAEKLFKKTLVARQRQRQKSGLEIANSLGGLGLLYLDVGNCTRAEALLEQDLAIRKRVLGPNEPRVAQSMGALASARFRQGDYLSARDLSYQALSIVHSRLGRDHPDSLRYMRMHARCDMSLRNYAQAERMLAQLVGCYERRYGPRSQRLLEVLDDYQTVLNRTGRSRKARALSERARTLEKSKTSSRGLRRQQEQE